MVLGIFGAGGLGREVLELAKIINEKDNRWENIIFVDDALDGKCINGVNVYSYNEALECNKGNIEITICVGEPATREKLFNKIKKDGIEAPTLIHPDVYIPESTVVGKGVTIQFGCFVSCNVVIEDYVFIQPNANVGHNDVLKKGCIISGMANLAGNVKIGTFTYVGISSAIIQGASIGDYCIIGMGSCVHKDIEDEVIAMGNPARVYKRNEEHRVFK